MSELKLKDVQAGMLVGYEGGIYKVTAAQATPNPTGWGFRDRVGGSKLTEIASIEPVWEMENPDEEVGGLVPVHRLKKLSQKDLANIQFRKKR